MTACQNPFKNVISKIEKKLDDCLMELKGNNHHKIRLRLTEIAWETRKIAEAYLYLNSLMREIRSYRSSN